TATSAEPRPTHPWVVPSSKSLVNTTWLAAAWTSSAAAAPARPATTMLVATAAVTPMTREFGTTLRTIELSASRKPRHSFRNFRKPLSGETNQHSEGRQGFQRVLRQGCQITI